MGETKKEKFVFTLLMCSLMVLGMTLYNLILNGGHSEPFFLRLIRDIPVVFLIALSLDVLLVGPLAKAFVFKVLKPSMEENPVRTVLMIATSMVTGMVLLMSAYGALMGFGFSPEAARMYPLIVLRNFLVAWPLNLLVVSPLVRFVLFPMIFSPEKKG